MKNTIIFHLPNNATLANALANKLNIEIGSAEIREFPDGESYIRINSDVKNKLVILVCSLDHPNTKALPLMFMAQTLKEFGAKTICLVAPYLSYTRQDKRFHDGEALTSALFAKFISSWIDCLITIDPHLHRIKKLSDVYSIPQPIVLHATQQIANWIKLNVDSPLLVGPDEESSQWVTEVAKYINADYIICEKQRYGDRNVFITIPQVKNKNQTPVLIDDIISTGTSLCVTLRELGAQGLKNPICIAVHALFNEDVEKNILHAGAKKIISCNTIPHTTNEIDITDLIASGIKSCSVKL